MQKMQVENEQLAEENNAVKRQLMKANLQHKKTHDIDTKQENVGNEHYGMRDKVSINIEAKMKFVGIMDQQEKMDQVPSPSSFGLRALQHNDWPSIYSFKPPQATHPQNEEANEQLRSLFGRNFSNDNIPFGGIDESLRKQSNNTNFYASEDQGPYNRFDINNDSFEPRDFKHRVTFGDPSKRAQNDLKSTQQFQNRIETNDERQAGTTVSGYKSDKDQISYQATTVAPTVVNGHDKNEPFDLFVKQMSNKKSQPGSARNGYSPDHVTDSVEGTVKGAIAKGKASNRKANSMAEQGEFNDKQEDSRIQIKSRPPPQRLFSKDDSNRGLECSDISNNTV